jgi:hypothetical protein
MPPRAWGRIALIVRRLIDGLGALSLAVGLMLGVVAAPASGAVVAARYRLTVSWGSEPALAGFANTVAVTIRDADGTPVLDANSSLVANVIFDGAQIALPLHLSATRRDYEAAIVPTRAGSYAVNIMGALRGHPLAATVDCSSNTFPCVIDAGAAEFPTRDPSDGELATRLARELARADSARSTATTARDLALVAALLAIVTAATLGGLELGRRRKAG